MLPRAQSHMYMSPPFVKRVRQALNKKDGCRRALQCHAYTSTRIWLSLGRGTLRFKVTAVSHFIFLFSFSSSFHQLLFFYRSHPSVSLVGSCGSLESRHLRALGEAGTAWGDRLHPLLSN